MGVELDARILTMSGFDPGRIDSDSCPQSVKHLWRVAHTTKTMPPGMFTSYM